MVQRIPWGSAGLMIGLKTNCTVGSWFCCQKSSLKLPTKLLNDCFALFGANWIEQIMIALKRESGVSGAFCVWPSSAGLWPNMTNNTRCKGPLGWLESSSFSTCQSHEVTFSPEISVEGLKKCYLTSRRHWWRTILKEPFFELKIA